MQYCNSWTPWIDNYHPDIGGRETELLTDAIRESLCPIDQGGKITGITCRDNKGEPFHSFYNRTSGDNKYMFSCGLDIGAICWIIRPNSTCPDYAYRLFCNCTPLSTESSTQGE